jgi:hypothetical protein
MNHRENIFHSQLIKRDGKLVHVRDANAKRYKDFIDSIGEGQTADLFMESNVDDGTLTQLAKIHACIRAMAKHVGCSFEDMKVQVKIKAGLYVKTKLNEGYFMVFKSFGDDCSREDLSLAIEAICEMGDALGINFR